MTIKQLLGQVNSWVEVHPAFEFDPENYSIEGYYELCNSVTGKVIDGYFIEVKLSVDSLSTLFPAVYETKGRIERIADRHMYPDGRLCLTTRFVQRHACRKGLSFSSFMAKVVEPFLMTQLLIERGVIDKFPQGEYSHGWLGIVEGYNDIIGVDDPELIIKLLLLNRSRKLQRPNDSCVCGSGKKFKYCHRSAVRKIGYLDADDMNNEIDWLKRCIGQHSQSGQKA